jgi:cell division protein FtsI/penicillin-binding protein 2
MLSAIANGGKVLRPQITSNTTQNQLIRQVFLPDPIRKILMDGMRRVVVKTLDDKIGNLSRFYHDYPEAISDFIDLRDSFVGKTSTAESAEYIDLDRLHGTNLYTHVWFGGISFLEENPDAVMYRSPELVVVVYLRYGAFGKEAAPLAAQIVKKWRDIKNRKSF